MIRARNSPGTTHRSAGTAHRQTGLQTRHRLASESTPVPVWSFAPALLPYPTCSNSLLIAVRNVLSRLACDVTNTLRSVCPVICRAPILRHVNHSYPYTIMAAQHAFPLWRQIVCAPLLLPVLSALLLVGCGPQKDAAKELNSTTVDRAPVSTSLTDGSMAGVGAANGTGRRSPVPNGYDYRADRDGIVADSAMKSSPTFKPVEEQNFRTPGVAPRSTFSIDVDHASYTIARNYIRSGSLPPAEAVRVEEMINYFKYDYPEPSGNVPFSVTTEIGPCPWNPQHRLALIGIQGRHVDPRTLPPSNLVFLIDVSGSMNEPNKLPLLKRSFRRLVEQLRPQDRVSIVVYAGAAGQVLAPTPGNDHDAIMDAIDELSAGGSTAGGAGIQLAYATAKRSFIQGGNNRVILATDGDFNVGVSSPEELEKLIEVKRKEGIFLSVIGVGSDGFSDATMETLADRGNGHYVFFDTEKEADKVFGTEFAATLLTIAKDVKVQVEFNPRRVRAYRLIGYDNRLLADQDFDDDTKDAGELGAGHSTTALYEIIPTEAGPGALRDLPDLDRDARSNTGGPADDFAPAQLGDNHIFAAKLRYKLPQSETSQLIVQPATMDRGGEDLSETMRFASSVAEWGLVLRDSRYRGNASIASALERARGAQGDDSDGYRSELVELMEASSRLSRPTASR